MIECCPPLGWSRDADHALSTSGQVIVGDKGFAGAGFEAFLTDQLGCHLLRPDRVDEPVRQ